MANRPNPTTRSHVRPRDLGRVDARVQQVCDAVGQFIEGWGFRSIHGRVWALLALSKHPLAQAEVAERLGVSRSLVNLAVSELEGFKLVYPSGPHRNAPYAANCDVWPIITDVLRSREWMRMERARLALDAAQEEVEFLQVTGVDCDYDLERLRWLLAMTEFAQTVLRTVLNVRMPESVDGLSVWMQRARRAVEALRLSLNKALGS